MRVVNVLLGVLCLLLLAQECVLWRRRRDSSPPPRRRSCRPVNCRKRWSSWSGCNHLCGNSGVITRREIEVSSAYCGGSCMLRTETQPCNRNKCQHNSVPQNGYCDCRPGHTGTCCGQDIDECATIRPCQQICTNTDGSYTCQCNSCYTKLGTRCELRQCRINSACYRYGTVNPNNQCQNCNRGNKMAWTNDNALSCNDGIACTRNDHCSNGRCVGTPFACLPCERCFSDTCQVKVGYCTIMVNGVKTCFKHGDLRPGYQCQQCDSNKQHSWTNNNNLPCSDNNVKTKDDRCVNGACIPGTFYSCLPCENQDGKGCPLRPDYCIIQQKGQRTCYIKQQIKPGNPCQWCNPALSSSTWTSREGGACDDGNKCTRADTCRNSQCSGTPLNCNSLCQFCNGNSCGLKPGFGFVNGKCACRIEGRDYNHQELNPLSECQWCDLNDGSAKSSGEWTNRPAVPCDDKNQCTKRDTCSAGKCVGVAYSCQSSYPVTSCVKTSECVGDGTCRSVMKPKGTICRAATDNCDKSERCDGSLLTCPAATTDAISMTTGTLIIKDSNFKVTTSYQYDTSKVNLEIQGFSTSCGKMKYNWYLIKGSSACSALNSSISGTLQDTSNKQTLTGLNLKDAKSYKLAISLLNTRNGTSQLVCSNAVTIDTSAPQGGWINDGAAADVNYQTSKVIQVNWGGIQARHGIHHYEWKVLYTPFKSSQMSELLPLTNVNLNTKAKDELGFLRDGSKIQVTVRSYTKAGLYSDLTSDGVVVDTSPSVAGNVFDGSQAGVDANFTKWTNTFSANWERFTDLHSPVVQYTWAVKRSGAGLLTAFKSSALNRSSTMADLNLVSGESYCAVVRGYNEAGLFTQATSNCVLIDHDAPRPGHVNDGTSVDISHQSSGSQMSANWEGFSDGAKGSGIVEYRYKIEDSRGRLIVNWTSAGNKTNITHSSLALTNGETYQVTVAAVDGVGWMTEATTNGVTVDTTRPVFTGKITIDGVSDFINETSCVYVTSLSSLTVGWPGFSDAHGGISSYKWAIVLSTQQPNSSDFQTIPGGGLLIKTSFGNLSLTEGNSYRIIIRAYNRVGLYTDATSAVIIPDITPPLQGFVSDGPSPKIDIDFQTDARQVSATWTPFDEPHTSVKQYYFAAGSCTQGNYHLTDNHFIPVSPPTATFFKISNLTLVSGQKYCTKVKAQNRAGLFSAEVTSNGFKVDVTPPNVRKAQVRDGDTGVDIDYQANITVMSAEWEGFKDLESGIKFYEFAISRNRAGVPDVKPFQNVGLQTKATALGLSLQEDVFYFLVCAVNFAGLRKCISSDGVLIDHSPPSQGVVHDGILEPDLKYQSSTTSMAANWEGVWDLQSGIEKFEWAIGTNSSDNSSVMPYTDVGLSTHVQSEVLLNLSSGHKYFVHLRITNQVGAVGQISSDGVIIDNTPPKPSNIYPAASGWRYFSDDKTFYTSRSNLLSVLWDNFGENESEIWYYKWSIGVTKCATQVQALINIGRTNNANTSMEDLQLEPGVKYYVTVLAQNRAGLLSRACSDAFVFDKSPPRPGTIKISTKESEEHQKYKSNDTILVSWSGFFDRETDITACRMTLLNELDSVLFTTTQNGSEGNVSVPSNITLSQGAQYHARVECKNKAGLSINISSPVFIIDNTPPIQNGHVLVGTSRDQQWQYQAARNNLHVTWPPFRDLESPVIRYDFAVGTRPRQDDVVSFENLNTETWVMKSGLSLEDHRVYYITVRATNAAGLTTTVSAQGLLIDTTPPLAANDSVKDGYQGDDRDFISSATDIAAHWEDIKDPESGITRNQYCIGTSPLGCQIRGMTDIGHNQSFVCKNCKVNPGVRVFVGVQVTNGAGLSMVRISNGMLLDDSPPTIGGIIDGSDANGYDMDTALLNWNVSFSWFGSEDDESGIEICRWTVKSKNGDIVLSQEIHTAEISEQWIALSSPQKYEALPFNHTVIYYNAIICTNKAGLSSTARSDGFRVVPIWPTPAPVRDGPIQGKDIEYATSSNRVTANWDPFEADAMDPVFEYAYSVGSTAGQADIHPFTSIGLATHVDQFLRPDVPELDVLTSGNRYYVTVRATSLSGLSSNSSSDGFVVDSSPPAEDAEIRVTHSALVQQTPAVDVLVSWNGVKDDESGISSVKYCIGTTPSTCLNGTKTVVNANSVTIYSFHPKPQVPYYVTMAIQNGAGLTRVMTSEKLTYDTTPPSRGQVIDGFVTDADFMNSTDSMSTQWSGFEDQESGVVNCTWTLVQHSASHNDSALGNALVIFEEVVSAIGHMTRQGLSLLPGARYVNKITCSNGDGFNVTSTSDGVIADVTTPLPGRVYDGSSASLNITFQASSDSVETTWKYFMDLESGIVGYRWGLGTSPGDVDVLAFTAVGKNVSGRAQNVSLNAGARYYVTVEATNGAGMTSSAWSDCSSVDPSPPEIKQLSRGSRAWLSPEEKLVATWSSADLISGIVKTEYCVGTVPVGCQIQPMTELSANATAVTCHDCRLEHLQTYYVSVRVWNGADLATVATTDSVHVDATPPFIGDVLVETEFTSCTTNCSLTSNITVFTDDESGLKSCSYAITNSTRHVTSFVDNALKNTIQASGVELVPGQKYWTVVRCENNVGLVTKKVSTASVLVDSTPPTKGSVIVSPDRTHDIYGVHSNCHLFNKTLRAHWSGFHDNETGITGFRVAVGRQPNASDVLPFREVGIVTTTVLDLSDVQGLFTGDILYVTVESRNPAGLTSTSSSPPTRLVSAGKDEYLDEGDFYCVNI